MLLLKIVLESVVYICIGVLVGFLVNKIVKKDWVLVLIFCVIHFAFWAVILYGNIDSPATRTLPITIGCGIVLMRAVRKKVKQTTREAKVTKKLQCPCCGYYTIDDYCYPVITDICPVCFWQFDWTAQDYPDRAIGPNHGVSLNQARLNYKEFGAYSLDMLKHVRAPLPEEMEEPKE